MRDRAPLGCTCPALKLAVPSKGAAPGTAINDVAPVRFRRGQRRRRQHVRMRRARPRRRRARRARSVWGADFRGLPRGVGRGRLLACRARGGRAGWDEGPSRPPSRRPRHNALALATRLSRQQSRRLVPDHLINCKHRARSRRAAVTERARCCGASTNQPCQGPLDSDRQDVTAQPPCFGADADVRLYSPGEERRLRVIREPSSRRDQGRGKDKAGRADVGLGMLSSRAAVRQLTTSIALRAKAATLPRAASRTARRSPAQLPESVRSALAHPLKKRRRGRGGGEGAA
eukprot:362203-Chlamydomonas_euryale.AAC.3